MENRIMVAFDLERLRELSERLYRDAIKMAKAIARNNFSNQFRIVIDENNPEYSDEVQKFVRYLFDNGSVAVYAVGADTKERFESLELEPFGSTTMRSVANGNLNCSGVYFFANYGVLIHAYQYENKGVKKTGYRTVSVQDLVDNFYEISKKPFNDFYVDTIDNMFYSIVEVKETPFETMKGCFDGYEM